MFLISAITLFAVFVANVLVGALGGAQFLGDVGEMLLLFAASVTFVLAILRRGAAEKSDRS